MPRLYVKQSNNQTMEKSTFVGYDLRDDKGNISTNLSTWVEGGSQKEIEEQVRKQLVKKYGKRKFGFRLTTIMQPDD